MKEQFFLNGIDFFKTNYVVHSAVERLETGVFFEKIADFKILSDLENIFHFFSQISSVTFPI